MPKKKILKSAVSGKFVSKKDAAENPRETYTAEIKTKFRAWVCITATGKPIANSISASRDACNMVARNNGYFKVVRVTCIVE